jgi:hypothetical protein
MFIIAKQIFKKLRFHFFSAFKNKIYVVDFFVLNHKDTTKFTYK